MRTKIMRNLFLLIAGFISVSAYGQSISVESVEETTDITASKYERKDPASGKSCALIKVEIPSVDGLSFNASVGETQHLTGVYYVYVAPGIKKLPIGQGNKVVCEVNFEKYGISIEQKHTYVVKLAVTQSTDVVFKVTPANAVLTINDNPVALDGEGFGKFSCEPGETYDYTLTAEGYDNMDGSFTYSEDDGSQNTLNIDMERKTVPVTFICNIKKFDVIVNDETFSMESNSAVNIPVGTSKIRIVAPEYEDWEKEIIIPETPYTVSATMKKSSSVSNDFRTRFGVVLGGGIAIPFGTDKYEIDDATGYPAKIGFESEIFLNRWFTFRPGLEAIFYGGHNIKIDDKSPLAVDVPLLFNVNVPLGKFNRNFFTIGLGPLLGIGDLLDLDDDKTSDKSRESSTDNEKDDTKFFVGGRVEARIIINHIMIGASVDYHYCKDVIMGDGLIAPMVTLGYRF